MNKKTNRTVVYLYYQLLFNNKNKHYDTHHDLNESHRHYAKQEKLDNKINK